MDKIVLKKSDGWPNGHRVRLSSSKSESNRLLLIDALAQEKMTLENLSTARDTQTMQSLLTTQPNEWDVKDAGTTMRFLTAYLAMRSEGTVITGTERMQQRPIGPLVEALRQLGAHIEYVSKEGFPPLRIQKLTEQKQTLITIPGNISSQYISALMMIAPVLPQGLTICLSTEVFSRPYIEMTLKLMTKYGVNHVWEGNEIQIAPQAYNAISDTYTVESDWSGASYWYAFVALGEGSLFLPNLHQDSTQGDQAIVAIMEKMGVHTTYENGGVTLLNTGVSEKTISWDFRDCPDLAQTVMVVAAAKGIRMEMTGLESLKIKETDRVQAMMNELGKLGAQLTESGKMWTLTPATLLPAHVEIATYDDHRMAMAFAPLCCLMDVTIDEPDVVKKSYPEFWEEVDLMMKG